MANKEYLVERDEYEKIIRDVLKEHDLTHIDAVKIFINTVNAFMQLVAERIPEKEALGFFSNFPYIINKDIPLIIKIQRSITEKILERLDGIKREKV